MPPQAQRLRWFKKMKHRENIEYFSNFADILSGTCTVQVTDGHFMKMTQCRIFFFDTKIKWILMQPLCASRNLFKNINDKIFAYFFLHRFFIIWSAWFLFERSVRAAVALDPLLWLQGSVLVDMLACITPNWTQTRQFSSGFVPFRFQSSHSPLLSSLQLNRSTWVPTKMQSTLKTDLRASPPNQAKHKQKPPNHNRNPPWILLLNHLQTLFPSLSLSKTHYSTSIHQTEPHSFHFSKSFPFSASNTLPWLPRTLSPL